MTSKEQLYCITYTVDSYQLSFTRSLTKSMEKNTSPNGGFMVFGLPYIIINYYQL